MKDLEFTQELDAISNRVLSTATNSDEEANYTEALFESIRHVNEYGQEFWYARELQVALEYTEWRNFTKVIDKAKLACEGSENTVSNHFVEVNKIVEAGVTRKDIGDIHLSRYACYLIVQNGDPRKKVIALGQSYFTIKTRQQELIENYEELAANLFRATQTEAKLRRENIQGKELANQTHYEVGKEVRDTIGRLGGTMPENLPTPEKSIKQIEKEQMKPATK